MDIYKFLLLFIIIIMNTFTIKSDNIDTFENNIDRCGYTSNYGINRCNGIIYINLDNRPDRKEIILKEMKKMGIEDNKLYKVSAVFTPANGHKGNVQSFILAITLAKLNNWDKVCIFEDDAEIINTNNFNKDVEYIIKQLDKNVGKWDCIMLGTAFATKENVNFDNKIKRVTSSTTKTGLIIQSHYYDTLLENFNKSNSLMSICKKSHNNKEVHASDQYMKKLQQKDKWFCFDKDIIKQRDIWSSTMRYSY